MSDVTDTDIQPADTNPGAEDVDQPDTPESDNPDATPEVLPGAAEKADDADTFPREVVEELRRENGKYRQRAGQADDLAKRLHLELVKATGRLADPTDLEFDESHLDDPDKLAGATPFMVGLTAFQYVNGMGGGFLMSGLAAIAAASPGLSRVHFSPR